MIPRPGATLWPVPATLAPCSSGPRLALACSETAPPAECRSATSLPRVFLALFGINQPFKRSAARLPLGDHLLGRLAQPRLSLTAAALAGIPLREILESHFAPRGCFRSSVWYGGRTFTHPERCPCDAIYAARKVRKQQAPCPMPVQ